LAMYAFHPLVIPYLAATRAVLCAFSSGRL
jgi:hypothetical protein